MFRVHPASRMAHRAAACLRVRGANCDAICLDNVNYGLIGGMPPTKSPAAPITPKTIAIVGKYFAAGIADSLSDIANFLEGRGHTVVFEAETAQNIALEGYEAMTPEQIGRRADAAVVVGGDGTMLGIARQLAPYGVPLIGINQGRLGFMTDISLDRVIPVLGDMLDGKFETESRALLEATVVRDGADIFSALAFNDVVVSRGATSGMVELTVEVDGRFMYNQRSDGLIVATPTGSTAYALSSGGPILHPGLGGIVLVPIAPHALSNRPIVVADSGKIVIEVVGGRDINANFDMQSLTSLAHGDRIVVARSRHTITFLHPEGWSYYDTLRRKLHWNEYPCTEETLK
jgi:NAD+ kinase